MKKVINKNHLLYELSPEDRLSILGMKTIRRGMDNLLPIREIIKNGHESLVCSTGNCIRLDLGRDIKEQQVGMLFAALSKVLLLCNEKAFLERYYIDLDKESIFVNSNAGKVLFPLLPVDEGDSQKTREKWDFDFKSLMASIFVGVLYENAALSRIQSVYRSSDDGGNEAIIASIIENAAELEASFDRKRQLIPTELEMQYEGDYGRFSLYVCKDEFTIGKSNDCDGVLSMNPTVSRHHCRVMKTQDGWRVEDIGSVNGTFVGNARLQAGQSILLHNGDRLIISDMEFLIRVNDRGL